MQPDFVFQPVLQNELVHLTPLQPRNFEELFQVASDPLIWELHPENRRCQRNVFTTYFEDAMNSGGAFLITTPGGEIMGSTRYYDFSAEESSIVIGATFLARKWWGGDYNKAIKKLMLDHAFTCVDKVLFYVGVKNFRSQKAMEKLSGKTPERELVVNNIVHYVYKIDKEEWQSLRLQ